MSPERRLSPCPLRASRSRGGLPFTGADIEQSVGIAVVLLVAGTVLVRIEPPQGARHALSADRRRAPPCAGQRGPTLVSSMKLPAGSCTKAANTVVPKSTRELG